MPKVKVKQVGREEASELTQLIRCAGARFQRVAFLDARAAASRFSLLAYSAGAPLAALISLWPEPPYPWLDGFIVSREESVRPAVDALLPPFLDAMRRRGASQVLVSASADQDSHPGVLERVLSFGFRQLAIYSRLRKTDVSLPPASASKVVLRPVVENDLSTLRRVDAASFPRVWRYGEGMLRKLLHPAQRTIVAILDERPVGFCSATIDDEGVGQVQRIAVQPSCRGLGIGATLLAEAIRHLGSAGAKYVELRSEQSQRAAWRLYRRFGFIPTGDERRVYGFDLSAAAELVA